MNAVVIRVAINDLDAAVRNLRENIVPMVSGLPGFVGGYWTRSDDGQNGLALVVFESADAAAAMVDGLRQQMTGDGPAVVQDIEVREVVANA